MDFGRSQESQEAVSYYEKEKGKDVGNAYSSLVLLFGRRPHRHLEAAAEQE